MFFQLDRGEDVQSTELASDKPHNTFLFCFKRRRKNGPSFPPPMISIIKAFGTNGAGVLVFTWPLSSDRVYQWKLLVPTACSCAAAVHPLQGWVSCAFRDALQLTTVVLSCYLPACGLPVILEKSDTVVQLFLSWWKYHLATTLDVRWSNSPRTSLH